MASSPQGLLDRPLLRQLAGDQSFARGEEYFSKGRVGLLQAGSDRITARVNGSRTYRVKLWRGRGELQFSCSCPEGREESFCKHCVAVGLAWLAGPDQAGGPDGPGMQPDRAGGRRNNPEDERARVQMQAHLETLDKARLIDLVLEATEYDDILRRRLLLETAGVGRPITPGKRTAPAPDVPAARPDLDAYRKLLREAIRTGGYVDYDAMPDYAQGVEEAVRPLADLLQNGYAAAVVELAEFALVELDKASEMLDGGDGSLNPIYDDLQRFHLEACRVAQPDPEAFAARVLHYEIEGGLGIFNNALRTYADVLGARGTVAWRRLLVREWTNLPRIGAGSRPTPDAERPPIDYRRFQIQALMERLADAEGDTAALIAIRERDLSSAHDYLALAELYQSTGRAAQALEWALRGLQAFPASSEDAGLREFLAGAYHAQGKHAEALSLIWEEFTRFGDAEHFGKLKEHVEASGGAGGDWPQWRDRALAHLRERRAVEDRDAVEDRAVKPSGTNRFRNGNALVEMLLSEEMVDEAWAEARSTGCRPEQWLALAAHREKRHPADALEVYRGRLGPTIALGGQTAYREAVELTVKIGRLLDRLGRAEEFAVLVADLRATYRGKRNFLKLLDAAGL